MCVQKPITTLIKARVDINPKPLQWTSMTILRGLLDTWHGAAERVDDFPRSQ
jgi:hypothetical protein